MKKILSYAFDYIKRIDKILLVLCITASVFSIVLLYTLFQNEINSEVTTSHYKTQILTSVLGIIGALTIAAINYKTIAKLWFIYAPITLILTLLLFTPLGITAAGTDDTGWLDLGFTTIQPSEFLKISFIMTFSIHLAKVGKKMNKLPHFLLLCLHGLLPVGLISIQGDDGSALVFLFIFLVMMIMAGLSWKYIALGAIATPLALAFVWNFIMQSHHKKRFLILFDPVLQEQEKELMYYQQYMSKIAIGSGQLTGQGLSGGTYTNVPAIQNDFIFSYIGMTLGFIGCLAAILLLAAICMKILSISSMAKDPLGKNICIGVFTMIAFHTIINVGMTLSVVPVIGIPLPFISAGGTSVISLYAAIGLAMSVYANKETKYHMFYKE